MKFILPENYQPLLDVIETEIAIKFVKDNFEKELSKNLDLIRVSAPLFVEPKSGLNDYLNGVERTVSFTLKNKTELEIVQSLAKWKRMALKKYNFEAGKGLYTDMNAIRCDEDIDPIHSIYVDQWDWEKIINPSDRNLNYLKKVVRKIYQTIKSIEQKVYKKYPIITPVLSKDIKFISSEELYQRYPNLSSKEREHAICKEFGSVFIYKIGWPLSNNKAHDGRAADYDDWMLNGDILVWYEPLQISLELSSMGIRVNKESLLAQLKHRKEENKLELPYVQAVLNDELPQTIGGGIGQSRLCMFFLKKVHIGEVQASAWPEEEIERLQCLNIHLL
ncbi:MAG: aspartate--ammonia ligase [Bacilli bacterium]|jgi:aspartate--ammonia ligase|nr:aspartate--ammonia ligase [Acholeplasmataceae bacterium]